MNERRIDGLIRHNLLNLYQDSVPSRTLLILMLHFICHALAAALPQSLLAFLATTNKKSGSGLLTMMRSDSQGLIGEYERKRCTMRNLLCLYNENTHPTPERQ